jgi:hypothetical protein
LTPEEPAILSRPPKGSLGLRFCGDARSVEPAHRHVRERLSDLGSELGGLVFQGQDNVWPQFRYQPQFLRSAFSMYVPIGVDDHEIGVLISH